MATSSTMFTRRHYVAVALALSQCAPSPEDEDARETWAKVAASLADLFTRDNNAFNKERFAEHILKNIRSQS